MTKQTEQIKPFYKSTKKKEPKTKKKKEKIFGCSVCKIVKDAQEVLYQVHGQGNKKILIIRDIPTRVEKEKSPYMGHSGSYLRRSLNKMDINIKEDCWTIYGVGCPKRGNITTGEINNCRINLENTIKKLQPEKILVFGKEALQSLLGGRMSVTGIEKWCGNRIPDQELKIWIYPLYSPKYILLNEKNIPLIDAFQKELKQAIEHEEPFPDNEVKEDQLELITTAYAATIYLEGLHTLAPKYLAFDYETTGLKPHAKGHEIICMSIATDNQKAVSFPIFMEDKDFLRALRRVLQGPSLKIAQNIPMEYSWTETILGYKVKNWDWDTLICQHLLNTKKGTKNLKMQVYLRFGTAGYDDSMKPYIESKDKSNNAFNRMKEAPILDVLKYCALDSIYTMWLFQKQRSELKDRKAFDLFMQGMLVLSETHSTGIAVDIDYYKQQDTHLTRMKDRLYKKIMGSEQVKQWNDEKEFNFNSSTHLKKLLFEILGYKSTKETKKGSQSTDQEALSKFKQPFVKDITQWKKLDKIQGTYLSGFIRETVDGIVRPSFPLHTTVSGRGSSNSPNFQNIPVRNDLAQRITRTGLKPRPGRQLLEVDFKGVEVSISACYHKDPNMINYIKDPSTDMHRDQARLIFLNEEITENERYLTKNTFVFPEFYGDYYRSCATGLWEKMDDHSKEHLRDEGIKTYSQFEHHVEDIEHLFWNERFKVYQQWKKDTWNFYLKHGYVPSLTGFIYKGIMDRKNVSNYPIQGSSFHCLLWSYIETSRMLKKQKMETLMIGQIHDAIIFDAVPDELEELKPLIRKITCEDLRKAWDWIIVPLNIDAEISDIDGNWAVMHKEEI